ncbi:MAG: hypothetical protein AAFY22_15085, partial [Pseudomonadota bacterium]
RLREAAFSTHGFQQSHTQAERWACTVDNDARVAEILRDLTNAGANIAGFTVTAPALGDAMEAAIKEASR